MLYQQIEATDKSKKSFEWKATLGLLSVNRKTETQSVPTQEKMLQAVIKEIEDAGQIGTVDEPNMYVKGTLPMRWGIYKDVGRPDAEPPLVYFGGKTEQTLFGFGGSSRHVVGFEGASVTGSRSSTPYLVSHLLDGLEIAPDGWKAYTSDDYSAFDAVAWANYKLREPDQNLEFFAKTLLTGSVRHHWATDNKTMKALLGTPLYVVMAAPYPEDWL